MATQVTFDPTRFVQFERFVRREAERILLDVTDRAARGAAKEIRARLRGRLGGAIGLGSDKQKKNQPHPTGSGFSATGWVYIRGKRGENDRALGAIISATEGAEIAPRRSPWLWIPTDAIPKKAGGKKMTPALYRRAGLDKRIGPLFEVPGRNKGESLLVAFNVSVDRFGRPGSAKRLPRRGGLRANRQKVDRLVAFVGIRRTSRTGYVDVNAIARSWQRQIPDMIAAEVKKLRGGR